jgi:hypothetical protein
MVNHPPRSDWSEVHCAPTPALASSPLRGVRWSDHVTPDLERHNWTFRRFSGAALPLRLGKLKH